MADYDLRQGGSVPDTMITKYKDMGDGTWALVTATDTVIAAGSIALPTTIYTGQKTVAATGTAEILAASQAIEAGVRMKALIANTGDVYVGDSGVTGATGYVLDAGEEIFIEIANLATIYLDVSVNGEGVSWVAS